MKKVTFFLLVFWLILFQFSGCRENEKTLQSLELEMGNVVLVTVVMEDSGSIKSMALSVKYNQEDYELLDGQWLNHQGVIADFNLENQDAAIVFKDETNYYGEIFEFRLRAKHNLVASVDDISIVPVLQNEGEMISCNGITLAMQKVSNNLAL